MQSKVKTDMAVAALSTASIALNTSPAPAPAAQQPSEAPQAFAKLVERAKPEDKAPEDGTRAQATPDGDAETAAAAEDSSVNPPEGEAKELPSSQPVDLLAEIEAMVTAASQLGVNQPMPIAPMPPAPVATPSETAATSVATTVALPADIATATAKSITAMMPTASDGPARSIGADTNTARAAVTTPVATTSTPAAPIPETGSPVETAESSSAATPSTMVEDGGSPRTGDGLRSGSAARSDIAALLASLKSVYQPAKPRDAVAAEAAPVPLPAQKLAELAAGTAPAAVAAAIVPAAQPTTAAVVQPVLAAVMPAVTTPKTARPAAGAAATSIVDANVPSATPLPDTTISQDGNAPLPQARTAEADTSTPPPADPAAGPALAPADTTPAPIASSTPTTSAAPHAEGVPVATQAEQSVARHLDLARDNQWLDRLARDISQAASQQGHLKFQLNPEHLGALTVEIANSASGTAIRMTADTDQARTIIADAQPRLLAEVRAQGLRVSESHVDLSQQGGGSSASAQGQQRQSSENHKPFAATQAAIRDDAGESASRDDGELYA